MTTALETIKIRLLLLFILMAISACQSETPEQALSNTQTQSDNPVSVIDFTGQRIQLARPAQRIVALAPHIVENLFTVGAGETIVGVMQHSDFPEKAKAIPIVASHDHINFEQIMALKPDLVIAWDLGNSRAKLDRLRELGLIVFIDQPDSLDDISTSLRKLGELTGNNKKAQSAADDFSRRLGRLRQQYLDSDSISVFYQVWNEPLYTINGKHIISDAIQTCGGENVFADQAVIAPRVGVEAVLAAKPQAIIAGGADGDRPAWLDDWLAWPSLPASRYGHLFYVNPDHLQRHTVRQILAIEKICADLAKVRSVLKSDNKSGRHDD